MSIYEAVLALVGPLPDGCEPLAWVVSAVILLYLMTSIFSILSNLFSFIGGR